MKDNLIEKKLIETTISLLKFHDSLDEMSIKEIIADSTISKSSFYRHFHSLEDLLIKYQYKLLNKYLDSTNSNSTVDEVIKSFLDYLESNKEFYLLIKKHNLNSLILQTLIMLENNNNYFKNTLNITGDSITFVIYGLYGLINKRLEN